MIDGCTYARMDLPLTGLISVNNIKIMKNAGVNQQDGTIRGLKVTLFTRFTGSRRRCGAALLERYHFIVNRHENGRKYADADERKPYEINISARFRYLV